jgi:histidinol-phosphate aminotransferase
VSAPAIAAGAAAIEDVEHVEASAKHNARWLPWLAAEMERLGLEVTPSVANFVLVHFPEGAKAGARAADAFLKQRAIIVRRVDAYGLPHALRITVGTEADNQAVVAALSDFVKGAAA